MKDIVADPKLAGKCGLYCAVCRAYRKGKCAGCAKNEKATWCQVRTCCIEREFANCADCADYSDPTQCGKFHNIFSRLIGFVLRSNRPACIQRIREIGVSEFAAEMAEKKRMSPPR